MDSDGLLQLAAFFVILAGLVQPCGGYLKRVFAGEPTFFSPVLEPLERFIHRLSGVEPDTPTDAPA